MRCEKGVKGQIALFMILAVLLVLVFGATLYFSTPLRERVQVSRDETKPIQLMVNTCLEQSTERSLELLGRQSGRIYSDQGGTILYEPSEAEHDEGVLYMSYNGDRVSYGITTGYERLSTAQAHSGSNQNPAYTGPNLVELHCPFASRPSTVRPNTVLSTYPWSDFPYTEEDNGQLVLSSAVYNDWCGTLGFTDRPKLPRLRRDETSAHSLQAQIESYVRKNVESCLQFENFISRGFEIRTPPDTGKIETRAVIGSEDVTVYLTYPLDIRKGGEQETKLGSFFYRTPARLEQVYAFARDMMEKDAEEIGFDISTATRNGIAVSVVQGEQACQADAKQNCGHDTVLVFTDTDRRYRPFTFAAARKNRAPALEYVGPAADGKKAREIRKEKGACQVGGCVGRGCGEFDDECYTECEKSDDVEANGITVSLGSSDIEVKGLDADEDIPLTYEYRAEGLDGTCRELPPQAQGVAKGFECTVKAPENMGELSKSFAIKVSVSDGMYKDEQLLQTTAEWKITGTRGCGGCDSDQEPECTPE